jgi:hypothetical protein
MAYGGNCSLQFAGLPFTAQTVLSVSMGSLRTEKAPAIVKKMFKKEVVPELVAIIPQLGQKFSGDIVLHFNEGDLTAINLTH